MDEVDYLMGFDVILNRRSMSKRDNFKSMR